jgi:pimeloyl-ACP methyl ester carboxylesterase
MFRSFTSQFIDEVLANVLLHRFLRFRGAAPVRGPKPDDCPAIFSGDLSSFYSPVPVPVDLTSDRSLVRETDHTQVWDYRFTSHVSTGWSESDRVWCRHWHTRQRHSGVTVVGVDGIVQMGTRWFRRLAESLNPNGIDVVALDAPFNFRRTPRGYRPGQLIVSGDLGHQLAVTRQAVLDLWRLVVSLQAQGQRVGLVGVSYGGWLSLLTSVLANGIDFLVAIAPPVDIIGMMQKRGGTMVRGVRRGIGYHPLDPAQVARLIRPVVPTNWPPRIRGERISLHAGRYDRLCPRRGIEQLGELWNTRFTLHKAAHYHLALFTQILPLVAAEACEFAGIA